MNSKNLSFVLIAGISTIVLSSLFINIWFLVLILVPIFLVQKFKIDYKVICIDVLIACGFCAYVFLLCKINFLSYIPNPLINKVNYLIETKYSQNTAALIEIIMLNEKHVESS